MRRKFTPRNRKRVLNNARNQLRAMWNKGIGVTGCGDWRFRDIPEYGITAYDRHMYERDAARRLRVLKRLSPTR